MVLDMGELAGAAEIGRMLGGVSRQRVQQIINRPDFPDPVEQLEMGKVWKREAVAAWMASHGRTVADEAE